jgi:octaprenyl-diphosphate synthase
MQQSAIRLAIQQGGLTQLEPIVAAIDSTGGLDYAARLARSEAERALAALDELPDSRYRSGLAALARFAVEHMT